MASWRGRDRLIHSEQPESIEVRELIRARQVCPLTLGHCHQAS